MSFDPTFISGHMNFPCLGFPFCLRQCCDTLGVVTGMAILDERLFVMRFVHAGLNVMQVYERKGTRRDYSECRRVMIDISRPPDIASCELNSCLYITDMDDEVIMRYYVEDCTEIGYGRSDLCFQKYGRIICDTFNLLESSWSVDDPPDGLSVTSRGSVLVTCRQARKLKEFTTDGRLLREIRLQADIKGPFYSVQLTTGHYLVCHSGCELHRLCKVNADGRVMQFYGETEWHGWNQVKLYGLVNVIVDEDGFVLLVEYDTERRIRLLSPSLMFLRSFDISGDIIGDPRRLYVDKVTRRIIALVDRPKQYITHVLAFSFEPKIVPNSRRLSNDSINCSPSESKASKEMLSKKLTSKKSKSNAPMSPVPSTYFPLPSFESENVAQTLSNASIKSSHSKSITSKESRSEVRTSKESLSNATMTSLPSTNLPVPSFESEYVLKPTSTASTMSSPSKSLTPKEMLSKELASNEKISMSLLSSTNLSLPSSNLPVNPPVLNQSEPLPMFNTVTGNMFLTAFVAICAIIYDILRHNLV